MTQKVQLQEAFKLALSMVLFYWLALTMDWNLPKFGAMAIVVVSLSTTGASLNKGVMRVVGTGLGALAGFVLLAWFSQSPSGMLLATAAWLVFVGYFLQTARQGDTWFNAGFLAVAVWTSSYMRVDTAFHFATTRFLETAAGVVLFTVVSMLLWPRTSGATLQQQGQALWEGMQTLFAQYRQQLSSGVTTADTTDLRTRLAGEYQQLLATLDAAYADTPRVRARKRVWETLRIKMRAFGNAQELWRESINDCRSLPLNTLLPGLPRTLDTLALRLEHGRLLWEEQKTDRIEYKLDDSVLAEECSLQFDSESCKQLPRFQQAALMNFVTQLQALDRNSRELLQTLRILANIDADSTLPAHQLSTDPYQPSFWNPERLLKALFPATCWMVSYGFWYYVNPPGGPAIPMMGAVFGLMMVMAPVNLIGLLIVLLLSMFITVAPVYMLLMPTLDSGFGLLALVFVYTFVFGYLGGRSPVLKLGPLAMFVMMVDINNQQVYSFMALATTGLVMLLGVSIVVVVNRLLSPMRPEQILLRSVHHFLNGSARIVDDMRIVSPRQQRLASKRRKRVFETAILPVSAQLPGIGKNLDYSLFPDNPPEKVQHLVESIQAVRLRIQTLETTFTTAQTESPALLESLEAINKKWRSHVSNTLRLWAKPGHDHAGDKQDIAAILSADVEQQLDKLHSGNASEDIDRRSLRNIYAVVGSTRSLLEALRELGDNMQQINWQQWSAARF
ncbi:FUSC family protein [Gammaproteobacteria bacterium]|nr:FUSC family protein [Gammaproteobacteria bacterium]